MADNILKKILARDPGEKEFHQAVQEVIDTIVGTFPDRKPIRLNLPQDLVGLERLRAAGVRWETVAFTRSDSVDASVRGVICDNAGLIMDFGQSFWTLSWNATRGELDQTESVMSSFVNSVRIVPAAAPAGE